MTRRITLPTAANIDVKIYTDKWAELDSGNFAVLMKLGNPTASADKAQFTHNHQTALYIYEQVLPSIGWNYNKSTGILTVNSYNGYLKTQIVSGGTRQATITTILPAAINAVYLWVSV